VTVDPGMEAIVIERFASLGTNACLTNAQAELNVGEGATLRYAKYQDESAEAFHLASLHVTQAKESKLDLTALGFGAKLGRTDVRCTLGEATNTQLRGVMLAGKGQTQDVLTYLDHAKPNSVSKQVFKGVADHDGRVAYDGHVRVAPHAQKTNAAQKNQNLLMSKDAQAASKPHLEIYADDVKCAHGSTTGQLSSEAIFYLRSRGIPEREAKILLTIGFVGEVIDNAPWVADVARERVAQWLR